MRLTCLQENLVEGIQTVGHIALRATALPVLKNILLKTEHGVLNLAATNLESGITHSVRGKVEEDGECLVPAKLLLDLLPLLPSGKLELSLENDGLKVTTEQASTVLRVVPTSDFPVIPGLADNVTEIVIGSAILKTMLQQTVVAVGKIEQRPQFNGVYLRTKVDQLVAAATDGFRLSEVAVMLPGAISGECAVIVPTATVQEVVRVLGGLGDEVMEVKISISDNQIQFSLGATIITSRVIDGNYPDYEPLFPKEDGSLAEVSSVALSRAIKATALFARAGMADITLEMPTEAGGVLVYSENNDVGAHRTEVQSNAKGEVVSVVLNARYLLDGISVLSGDGVNLRILAADRPVMLSPVKENLTTSRYLVMPIRR